MVMKDGTKTITFRVSQELYNSIVDSANIEKRSINNLLTYIVSEYIENKSEKNKGRD